MPQIRRVFEFVFGFAAQNGIEIGAGLAIALVASLGVVCGAVTTLSGIGGGLLLIISLAALWGPHRALPICSLALVVGNLHRLVIYREFVRADVAVPLMVGLVPGSVLGAFLVANMPAALIQIAMLGLAGVAIGRAVFGWTWRVPRSALTAAGGAIGVMAGASGSAGVLTNPLVLATGIRGDEYMGTIALAATAMHIARMAGYGAGGLVDASTWQWAGLVAATLVVGNLIGHAIRNRLDERIQRGCEYVVLAIAVVLALLGVG